MTMCPAKTTWHKRGSTAVISWVVSTPPSERVVVHVRDAGQATPHLEHSPVSLLGAWYAIPRRKLNDSAGPQGRVDASPRIGQDSKNLWRPSAETT